MAGVRRRNSGRPWSWHRNRPKRRRRIMEEEYGEEIYDNYDEEEENELIV